jgi:hypothetical protein
MKRRRNIFFGFIGLVVLIILGWNGYGWWLKHKLERYKSALIAQGEKLTVNEVVGTRRIPDEENGTDFFLQSTAQVRTDGLLSSNPPPAMRLVVPGRAMIGWQQRFLTDRIDANDRKPPFTNTWEELAADLARSSNDIALLDEVVKHPNFDFHLNYNAGFNLLLPHLAPLKRSEQVLSAAALLDLHDRNTASATQHIRAMLALIKGVGDEPLLISQLVRMAMAHISFAATWELLQAPDISDAELQQIQSDYGELDFITGMESAFEMERAMGGMTIRHFREKGGIYDMFSSSSGGGSTNVAEAVEEHAKRIFSPREIRKTSNELLWQSALSYADEIQHLQQLTVLVDALRQAQSNAPLAQVYSNAVVRMDLPALAEDDTGFPFNNADDDVSLAAIRRFFAEPGGALLKSIKKLQTIEAGRGLAIAAIALKRYHIQNESYPDKLSALVPKFLASVPIDPVDQKPLRYQRTPDGEFLLYSIGEDDVDNGGDASNPDASFTGRPQIFRGKDWVWPQPASSEEVRKWQAGNKPSSE